MTTKYAAGLLPGDEFVFPKESKMAGIRGRVDMVAPTKSFVGDPIITVIGETTGMFMAGEAFAWFALPDWQVEILSQGETKGGRIGSL